MALWMNLGHALKLNASKFPKKIVLKDKDKSFTYNETNKRVNQLSHSLLSSGLKKGDKIAVLMENSIEMVELFLAAAKTGIIIVPINFRLVSKEIEYILDNSDAKLLIVHDEFVKNVEPIRHTLDKIIPQNYIIVGEQIKGYIEYETFIKDSSEVEPEIKMLPEDVWILIYTSGTTGKPKGVIRTHESHIAFYLINAIEFGFNENDVCLNVMPLCHINSTFYTFLFIYIGASAYIHPAQSFKTLEILEIIEKNNISFISLVPTHYNLILNTNDEGKKFNTKSVKKLLCSSAPVQKAMKKAIMDFFPGVKLFEAYGSTEAGLVTILKPKDQMKKLGSIGKETIGTEFVKILDEKKKEVPEGEIGEIYSKGPMLFEKYYKLPEKTEEAFKNGWFSAGDMGRKDQDGYYYIVDRKDNMIISGGENVYPSEIEEAVCSHPDVFDAAIIGLFDEKWGEKVTAVAIPQKGAEDRLTEKIIIDFCRDKVAGFKRPKSVIFIKEDEMPRTATGKILHRILRKKYI